MRRGLDGGGGTHSSRGGGGFAGGSSARKPHSNHFGPALLAAHLRTARFFLVKGGEAIPWAAGLDESASARRGGACWGPAPGSRREGLLGFFSRAVGVNPATGCRISSPNESGISGICGRLPGGWGNEQGARRWDDGPEFAWRGRRFHPGRSNEPEHRPPGKRAAGAGEGGASTAVAAITRSPARALGL